MADRRTAVTNGLVALAAAIPHRVGGVEPWCPQQTGDLPERDYPPSPMVLRHRLGEEGQVTTQWIGKEEPTPPPRPAETTMFPVRHDPPPPETPERKAVSVLDEWRIKSAARPLPGDKPHNTT